VIAPVPEELRDGLAKAVEGHVGALLGKYSCGSGESSGGDDDDDDDDAGS
jgi:hypothetical protein